MSQSANFQNEVCDQWCECEENILTDFSIVSWNY